MADSKQNANSSNPQIPHERKLSDTIPMESVQRLAKFPVVESSLNIATDVYSKMKEASSVLNWTFSTAESTVSRAVEHAMPVAERLERPLKRVDTLLCSSLDYVESKVPAVKLPPQQLLENTSNYVESKLQPALEKAAELKQFGAEKVSAVKNFAMDSSNTTQIVNSCTKMATTGMEVAQRYISNAGAQLANGEVAKLRINDFVSDSEIEFQFFIVMSTKIPVQFLAASPSPYVNGFNGSSLEHDKPLQGGLYSPPVNAITAQGLVAPDHNHTSHPAQVKRLHQHAANGRGDATTLPTSATTHTSTAEIAKGNADPGLLRQ